MTKTQAEQLLRLVKRSGLTFEDLQERWEYRAAIREYCGGAKRAVAERDALDDVANEVLR